MNVTSPIIENIRIPEEIRKILLKINERVVRAIKNGGFDGTNIDLGKLPEKEALIKSFFLLIAEADEILGYLNLCLQDMDRLQQIPNYFPGDDPFQRYTLIVRTFLYEFARFEDIFSYVLLFLERRDFITKNARKSLRNDFYKQIEPMVKFRNTLAHDGFNWEGHITTEITILRSADAAGMMIVPKDTGTQLKWENELNKVISEKRPLLYKAGKEMQVFWSMLVANLTHQFIQMRKI